MSRKVVLSAEEFKKLIERIAELEKQLAECNAANEFLNKQIREYNKKIANKDKDG